MKPMTDKEIQAELADERRVNAILEAQTDEAWSACYATFEEEERLKTALNIACTILASQPSDDVDGSLDAGELAEYYLGLAALKLGRAP